MPRETRGQRRRAKAKAAGKELEPKQVPAKAGASQRARQRQAQVRPAAQPIASQTGRRGRGPRERGKFIKECWGELQKVEWPGRGQVVQGTIVVLIACIIVGAFLYGADQAFKPFVRNVLLGQ